MEFSCEVRVSANAGELGSALCSSKKFEKKSDYQLLDGLKTDLLLL